MANQITGKILQIGPVLTIATQKEGGQPFQKRELILDATRYDPITGNKFENFPLFEFVSRNVNILDNFAVGQIVTVSFVLSGRRVDKDGETRFFTNVTGYKVEPYQRQQQVPQGVQGVAPSPQPTQGQQVAQQGANVANTVSNVAPAQQGYAPALDENGNPIEENPDNLPF